MNKSKIIKLNVGGTHFETTQTTLSKSSYFESLLARWNGDNNEEIFIDRNPVAFEHILNLLRDDCYSSIFPSKYNYELDFYGITIITDKDTLPSLEELHDANLLPTLPDITEKVRADMLEMCTGTTATAAFTMLASSNNISGELISTSLADKKKSYGNCMNSTITTYLNMTLTNNSNDTELVYTVTFRRSFDIVFNLMIYFILDDDIIDEYRDVKHIIKTIDQMSTNCRIWNMSGLALSWYNKMYTPYIRRKLHEEFITKGVYIIQIPNIASCMADRDYVPKDSLLNNIPLAALPYGNSISVSFKSGITPKAVKLYYDGSLLTGQTREQLVSNKFRLQRLGYDYREYEHKFIVSNNKECFTILDYTLTLDDIITELWFTLSDHGTYNKSSKYYPIHRFMVTIYPNDIPIVDVTQDIILERMISLGITPARNIYAWSFLPSLVNANRLTNIRIRLVTYSAIINPILNVIAKSCYIDIVENGSNYRLF